MTAQHPHSALDVRLPSPGEVVAGKYRIDAFIARGGMGAVFAATHVVTGRRLALKWVLPDADQDAEITHRVVREAKAAARVRHANVVDVYDVGEHDGSLFMVMELLEGETLHARLKASGSLDARTTLTLLLPAMRAIAYAHENDVVHRDLKPSNIFLCNESGSAEITTRVLDFGISKILTASGDGERSLTRTGAVLGTPHFMAPEQLTGGDTDARADVYALGVILYRCLTGRLPFQDSNYNALVLKIATATPPAVSKLAPHVPAGLSAAVMRAMAREARDRFASVGALIEAVSPFVQQGAHTPSMAKGRLWLVAIGACLVAAALGAWWSSERADAVERAEPPAMANQTEAVAPAAQFTAPSPPAPPERAPGAQPTATPKIPPTAPEPPPARERAREQRAPRAPGARSAGADEAPAPAKQLIPISAEQF